MASRIRSIKHSFGLEGNRTLAFKQKALDLKLDGTSKLQTEWFQYGNSKTLQGLISPTKIPEAARKKRTSQTVTEFPVPEVPKTKRRKSVTAKGEVLTRTDIQRKLENDFKAKKSKKSKKKTEGKDATIEENNENAPDEPQIPSQKKTWNVECARCGAERRVPIEIPVSSLSPTWTCSDRVRGIGKMKCKEK